MHERSDRLYDPFVECLEALDYMESCIRLSDSDALHKGAFVWAQRRDHILAGTESWYDQHLPAPSLGGLRNEDSK